MYVVDTTGNKYIITWRRMYCICRKLKYDRIARRIPTNNKSRKNQNYLQLRYPHQPNPLNTLKHPNIFANTDDLSYPLVGVSDKVTRTCSPSKLLRERDAATAAASLSWTSVPAG